MHTDCFTVFVVSHVRRVSTPCLPDASLLVQSKTSTYFRQQTQQQINILRKICVLWALFKKSFIYCFIIILIFFHFSFHNTINKSTLYRITKLTIFFPFCSMSGTEFKVGDIVATVVIVLSLVLAVGIAVLCRCHNKNKKKNKQVKYKMTLFKPSPKEQTNIGGSTRRLAEAFGGWRNITSHIVTHKFIYLYIFMCLLCI